MAFEVSVLFEKIGLIVVQLVGDIFEGIFLELFIGDPSSWFLDGAGVFLIDVK